MNYFEIQPLFDRAVRLTFSKTKWLITFGVLALCGVFTVFSKGLAESANKWLAMSLTFLPVFLCFGILLALGVVLIRGYHDEIKKKTVNYPEIFKASWESMLGAAYVTIPVILIYLMLWMVLGVFLLLQQIPAIGGFFAVVLAFAPFLLNMAALLLCVLVVGVLFFVAPIVALKGMDRSLIAQVLSRRFQKDIFFNLILFLTGLLPLFFTLILLLSSAYLTESICPIYDDAMHQVLQSFFIMIPFTALMAPAVIFFFNFAAESHVIMQKSGK
jgi:hypothetical protein